MAMYHGNDWLEYKPVIIAALNAKYGPALPNPLGTADEILWGDDQRQVGISREMVSYSDLPLLHQHAAAVKAKKVSAVTPGL
jgi:hypothetical protein